MKILYRKAVLLTLATFIFAFAQANTYYFSATSGDDSRTSTAAQSSSTPWKTINKLNSIFSSLLPGDVVLFKRGETFYGTIMITNFGAQSSTPITIGAYGTGAKPIITGLQNITQWTSLGDGIYESKLSQESLNTVVFQNVLQPVARWPKVTAPNSGYLYFQSHSGTTSITSDMIGAAKNFVGGEVVIPKWNWLLDRGIITGQSATTVTYTPLVSPAHPNFTYEPRQDGFGFFFQNHVNALTELGDWMYDRTAKSLKVYFGTKDPTQYSVKAATAEKIVQITNSSFITLDNLALIGSNANAIAMEYAFNIQITNCDINYSGIDAIKAAEYGAANITVRNCTIANSYNSAIAAFGTEGWVIQNNIIRNSGSVRGMGLSGDNQYNAVNHPGSKSLIEFNQIINTGFNAIDFQGDSTIIKHNLIDSFCLVKCDGGGIYTSAETTKTGRKIIGNVVLNGFGDLSGRDLASRNNPYAGNVHGIYMDGGATDVEVTDNTVANCSSSGIELSSPRNAKVLRNTLFNNTYRQIYFWESKGLISNLTLKENVLVATKSDQLVLYIDGAANTPPNWGTLDSNYYCRPISEPDGVDTAGYSHTPTFFDYPDGGIVQAYNFRFYSLDKWKSLSQQDVHTKKTAIPVSDLRNIKFEYNATNGSKTITLDTVYLDVKGNTYTNSVTLSPYSSIVLLKPSRQQTISFGPLSNKNACDPAFNLTATSSSGLPVSFKIVSGPAVLTNNTLKIVDTGKVIVEALQPGNLYYYAAPPVRQSFEVLNSSVTFLNNGMIVLNATCGQSDGSLSIIPTGGKAPFLYSIDGGQTYVPGPDAGYTFGNLPAGTYKLRLKEVNGCASVVVEKEVKSIGCTVTPAEPTPPPSNCTAPTFLNNSMIVGNASCGANDGSLYIIPTSGTAPFMYSIDGGKTYVSGPDAGYSFTNLSAGTYQLRMKEASGCESDVVEKSIIALYGDCATVISKPRVQAMTEAVSKESVATFPNPSKGRFNVQLQQFASGKVQVQVWNSNGVVVQQREVNASENRNITFDLSGKAKGLYFVRVASNQGIVISKVLIQ